MVHARAYTHAPIERLHYLLALHKAKARYKYEPAERFAEGGPPDGRWEAPTPKRASWRWDTQTHGPPVYGDAPKGKRKAKAKAPTPVPAPPPEPPAATAPPPPPTSTTPRPMTLQWRGPHDGRAKGQTIKVDGKWVVVLSAKRARTRRLTSLDEDMGHGMQGDHQTTQEVTVRDATPEEVAREEKRRADAEAAKRAATPEGKRDAWRAAHPDAQEVSRASGVTWGDETRVGSYYFRTGVGEDGAEYAVYGMSNYDDHREVIYRTAPDPTKQATIQARYDQGRDILDRIATSGTFTSADLEYLTDDLRNELSANDRELEAPGRLRLDANGKAILTPDGHRLEVLNRVLRGANYLGKTLPGERDLAFEATHGWSIVMARNGLPGDLTKVKALEPPPTYHTLVAEAIAEGEHKAELKRIADEEAKQRAAEEKARRDAARAAARSSSSRSSRSSGGRLTGSFRKLRDGSWGVSVDGDASPGDTVTVTKKDGSTKRVTLGSRVSDGLFRVR